jgi:hypothetical protein
MKNSKKIIPIIIALCIVGLLLALFEFLALHDIHNEYVSARNLERLEIGLSKDLPDWTSTKGEWMVVRIGYLFRFFFFILSAVLLYGLISQKDPKQNELS